MLNIILLKKNKILEAKCSIVVGTKSPESGCLDHISALLLTS